MDVQPGNLHYKEHLARYELARKHVLAGPLLDIASGTGYGTDLLQAACQSLAVGADIHQPSVVAAQRVFTSPQVEFLVADGTALPFASHCFSSIISMETLEHIADDQKFLGELARVLRPKGICIVSSSNREYAERHGIAYPYHFREHSEAELLGKLSDIFQPICVYYQGYVNSYHTKVHRYAESIQTHKRRLPGPMRWAIDHIYRPIKHLIPAALANYSIRKVLGITYPQPDPDEIALSTEPVADCSNFVVVCRKPAG